MPDTGVRVETAGDVTIVRLDRPPVNAVDAPAIDALRDAFEAADKTRPVILTGTGKAFSAGVDTRAFGSYSGADKAAMIRGITRMTAAILAHPVPVVAAVNGHALGGGFVMMLCADVRIVTNEAGARFGMPEAKAGVPFPAGPLEIIRHEVAPPLLRQLTLMSETISAETLLEHRLADRLVPGANLMAVAAEAAREVASQPGFSVVKKQMRGGLQARLEALAKSGEDPLARQFT